MKLKNIKTDEIVDFIGICVENGKYELAARKENEKGFSTWFYDSLTKLWQDWDDYDEPEIVWYLNISGDVCCAAKENYWGDSKEIGNYFETKEEAEKALEKLKAWKRLKDKGFKFCGWEDLETLDVKDSLLINRDVVDGSCVIGFRMTDYENCTDDLELLFGEEE